MEELRTFLYCHHQGWLIYSDETIMRGEFNSPFPTEFMSSIQGSDLEGEFMDFISMSEHGDVFKIEGLGRWVRLSGNTYPLFCKPGLHF